MNAKILILLGCTLTNVCLAMDEQKPDQPPAKKTCFESHDHICSICTGEITGVMVTFARGHRFCERCINEWRIRNPNARCPICRQPIQELAVLNRALAIAPATVLPKLSVPVVPAPVPTVHEQLVSAALDAPINWRMIHRLLDEHSIDITLVMDTALRNRNTTEILDLVINRNYTFTTQTEGENVLTLLIEKGFFEQARTLVEQGRARLPAISTDPTVTANILSPSGKMVSRLLVYSGNPQAREFIAFWSARGFPINAFFWYDNFRAAEEHDFFDWLVAHGADIHTENDLLLYNTCRRNFRDREESILFLINHGANVHVAHDTPMKIAIKRKNCALIRRLIELGVDIHFDNDAALRVAHSCGIQELAHWIQDRIAAEAAHASPATAVAPAPEKT